ncbi:hypothetical protein LSCM1_08095 [Leishmania martiniquensis]|uniref:Transmembrane protein n=1 Tax=Leishmania martiniquensis TaxID=1580590 RepID=A0A836KYL2_9TRYP|nr:hypothetical protein LSCM1_08095 [Leishmania martiniquensis]
MAAANVSACPYYPMWALLAGVRRLEASAGVVAGRVGVDAAKATAAETEAHRRTSKAAAAVVPPAGGPAYVAPDDFISALSGPRKALTAYYQVLSTDIFYYMLQGCTIRISIDTDVPPAYPYNSFQRYVDAYALNVSATGGDGRIHGHASVSRCPTSSARTRAGGTEGDDVDGAVYPNITLQAAFFFWNQPRLHCARNAPALMSIMIDLMNQQQQQQEDPASSQLRRPHSRIQAREESHRALSNADVAVGYASVPLTAGEATTGSASPPSTGAVYPSCVANMPSPSDILSSSQDARVTMDRMQLGSSVIVKIFSFDVWCQLAGAPVPSALNTGRPSVIAAPSSVTYETFFSSDPTIRNGGGDAGVSTDSAATAGQPYKLLVDPEKVCTAPALYTISLNPLLAQASSWGLGSAAEWLQSSVTVTHDYPAVRVVAVVAQCSGVPLSFTVTASFANPGNFAGSGEHYFTSVIYAFFLVCYALLLAVFLVMIVPCNEQQRQRHRSRHASEDQSRSATGSPCQATATDEKRQSSVEYTQRCAGTCGIVCTRGQRRGRRTNSRDGQLRDSDGGTEATHVNRARNVKAKEEKAAATTTPRTRALARHGTAEGDSGVSDAGSEPLHRESGESGGYQRSGGAGPPPPQQQQQAEDERVAERCCGSSEGNNSQTTLSSLYSVHSRTSRTSSSDDDIDGGRLDAERGARGRDFTQSSRHCGSPLRSSLAHTSSFTLSSSSSGDDSEHSSMSSSSSGSRDSTHHHHDDGYSRASRRRQRRKKQRPRRRRHVSFSSASRRSAASEPAGDGRSSSTDGTDAEWNPMAGDTHNGELRQGAQAWRDRGEEGRQSGAQGASSAFASPRRWRARVKRVPDGVRRRVLHPLRDWWAKRHILVMYAPIQWLVLTLIVLKSLLTALLAAKFLQLAGVHFDAGSIAHRLPLVCVMFEVATDSLLIPTEMLVAMGWGLAFTTPLPTNHIVITCLATLTMFVLFVFSATCETEQLSMVLTINRYTKLINGRPCNAIVFTRAALELVCRVHNVLRMLALSVWLSKTVVPADAAAVVRQRKLRQRQLQRAQREGHQGHGMAGAADGIGELASDQSDFHRRTSSVSSSSSSAERSSPSLDSTIAAMTGSTAARPLALVSLRPPLRLGYPGVSLSAMEVYLRYLSMRVPFAMLLVWPLLRLVCGYTFYEPEDYYMAVALREVQVVHLLGVMIALLRTSSPLYC